MAHFKTSSNTNYIMKKILFLLLAVCFSAASFSAPWDINTGPRCYTKSYVDPYVTNYGTYIVGSWSSPDYALNIQISFNQNVGVPYYAVVGLWGKWGGSTSSSYREFTVLFNSWQSFRSVNFPMAFYEEAYTATADLLDYGPQ